MGGKQPRLRGGRIPEFEPVRSVVRRNTIGSVMLESHSETIVYLIYYYELIRLPLS